MRFLLDTHVLLWAAGKSSELSKSVRALLEDQKTDLYFSAASLWEISIKRGLGRADFRADPRLLRRGLLDNGYTELAITGIHALALEILPPIHKDPFDRILVAQAISESITLLTTDPLVAQYPCPVQKI